ncbi:MAG TPA: TonB-dependent receptor, partial [Longimicrobiaceae bacterium]|nr:TonB-dependent receptor [Longimicrobiaceae bacterium]
NRSGSTRFRGAFGATAAEVTLAVGDYSARLPLVSPQSLVAEGATRRARLSLDLARRFDAVQLQYGLSVDEQEHEARATPVGGAAPSASVEAAGRVAGIYGEVGAQPLPRLRLHGGARVDHFSTAGETVVAPRMAATWLVTDRAALTLAAGRYHQFLRPPDEVLLQSGGSAPIPLAAAMVVGSSSHFTVSLDQDLGEGVRLGIEGFYKQFTDVPATSSTQAHASGMDLWIRRSSGGINGWLGYSLAWVWSNSVTPGSADFAGRHLLSTGLAAPLGARTNVELRFAYGAGLPYAAIPVGGPITGSRDGTNYVSTQTLTSADRGGTETAPLLHTPDQPFLRLDAAISQRWTSRRGSRAFEFSPYLRVLNSLGRRDALFYFLDPDRGDELRAIGALPLVPVLGLEWKF